MSLPSTDWFGSACRCCRHYRPEGRRGGQCSLLGVEVQGDWPVCHFAVPPFAPSWERVEGLGMADALGTLAGEPHWHRGLEQPLGIRG